MVIVPPYEVCALANIQIAKKRPTTIAPLYERDTPDMDRIG
jgi:hypothetical protein